jgi:flagellum-specific ATP synthase
MSLFDASRYLPQVQAVQPYDRLGTVSQVVGLMIEAVGPVAHIGELCEISAAGDGMPVLAEVVGFRENRLLLMPFGRLTGLSVGSRVKALGHGLTVPVGMDLRGRILDGLGEPIDGDGPLRVNEHFPTDNPPPSPLERQRIDQPLSLGVRALDGLLTCGRGQRLGIFAGSGVGKSTLLGMIARHSQADINVIALVGERGREVREFIEKDLQAEGLAKSVLVVATSDQPAIIRQKSALVSTAIAEYFRDQGLNVLLLMDSLTRFAMAQREIGMSVGEPPVSRGYTPSVFNVLPQLLERTGTGRHGSITSLYTVLVEGDDMNEPIADTVRGILDGHVVLSRTLAHRNHYPAIDVLASISRIMPQIVPPEHLAVSGFIRSQMSTYRESQDMIRIGAYKKGASAEIDEAIRLQPAIEGFLRQSMDESAPLEATLARLLAIRGCEA